MHLHEILTQRLETPTQLHIHTHTSLNIPHTRHCLYYPLCVYILWSSQFINRIIHLYNCHFIYLYISQLIFDFISLQRYLTHCFSVDGKLSFDTQTITSYLNLCLRTRVQLTDDHSALSKAAFGHQTIAHLLLLAYKIPL